MDFTIKKTNFEFQKFENNLTEKSYLSNYSPKLK